MRHRWLVATLCAGIVGGCGEEAGVVGDRLESLRFCSSSAGTRLEILGEKANEANFQTGKPKDPKEAQAAIDEIMRISQKAPPGNDCAYRALARAADAYRLDYLPDSSAGLREVQRFQREHDLSQADVLSVGR